MAEDEGGTAFVVEVEGTGVGMAVGATVSTRRGHQQHSTKSEGTNEE